MTLRVVEKDGGAIFRVRVAPHGGRDEVIGKHGDAIRVRLVDGRVNEALRDFLAARLDVSRQAVRILSGRHSRWKRVRVEDVTSDAVRALLRAG